MSEKTEHIIILATSDIHGNLTGYNYSEGFYASDGMARLLTCVEQIRAEEENVVLIDGGDMISGSVMLNDICPGHPDDPHPVMKVMGILGYDAAVMGNHDLDLGTDYLEKTVGQADFPVLAANVRKPDGSLLTGKGYTIIERAGVRIAIVGVVTPFAELTAGGAQGVSGLTFTSGADAVTEVVRDIDGQYDVMVVSAHMGGYGEYDPEGGSDSAWHIADAVPQTDVLHMGHTHVIDLGKRGRTVYGETRDKARELLRFDVFLGEDRKAVHSEVSAIDLGDYEPSKLIAEDPYVKKLHQETIDFIAAGAKKDEDSPVIGYCKARFQPESTEKGVPIARLQETPVTNLINKVQLEYSGADISACCLFDPYCDLEEGPITLSDVKGLYKLENFLVTVDITGKELKDYLEMSARCYETAEGADAKPRLNEFFPDFLQDYFSGVSYEIHVRNKPGDRIRNMKVNGGPVTDSDVYKLALHNYRYSTTLKKEGVIAADKDWQSRITVREMIEDYVRRHSPIAPELEGNWKVII